MRWRSIVNVVAAAFAAYSLHLAHTPADAAHPYGHGKIEFVSAGFEGGMILVAALATAIKAIGDFVHGVSRTKRLDLGVGLLIIAAAREQRAVGLYLVRTGRRQSSATLEADGHHLLSDAITSVVALAALTVVWVTKWAYADPIGALLVSLYIAWIGWQLMRQAGAGLMDRAGCGGPAAAAADPRLAPGADRQVPRICTITSSATGTAAGITGSISTWSSPPGGASTRDTRSRARSNTRSSRRWARGTRRPTSSRARRRLHTCPSPIERRRPRNPAVQT